MADRIAPNLYTQRGLNRVRQSILIDKLNVVRNTIRKKHSSKQIQRSINISKTDTNKYVNLVKDKI